MDGSFGEDLERWLHIWANHSRKGRGLLAKGRLLWAHPSLRATALFRLSTLCVRRRIPLLPGLLHGLNVMVCGLDIVPGISVGGGLYIPHPVGTVVMARCIGRNVTLVSNVTIGMRHEHDFPTIGDDVYIGAGARVLGPVTIGNGASIGANAVVLTDVPTGATAVGVPARIIRPAERERHDVAAAV